MRVYSQLPVNDWKKTAEAARLAEAAGYDGVSTSELAYDLFMPLAIAASVTERVKLNTSIAVAFPRSPMITANIGHDLQTNSGGRFELGLGSQVKGHNERRFLHTMARSRREDARVHGIHARDLALLGEWGEAGFPW